MKDKFSVVAIGDPHFKIDNVPEVDLFIGKIEELCKDVKPEFIVVLGDVLHTHERLHTIPLNKATEFISKLRNISPVYVLVGNHDMINNSQFLSENHWMNPYKNWNNVTIVDKVIHTCVKGKEFIFVPYVPVGKFREALSTINIQFEKVDCIFAHQEFLGCKMGAITSSEGDIWDEKLPFVISGHIHSNQRIGNVYYPGSYMQNAFGESEKNIIPILRFSSSKDPEIEEIDLNLPRKKIIYTDIDDIEKIEEKLTLLEDTNSDKEISCSDKIKISISGDYEEFKAFKKTKKYKDIVKKGAKIVFKPKKAQVENEKKDIQTLMNSSRETEDTDFMKILSSLVTSEKNFLLYQLYEKIVNGKDIKEGDIVFI